MSLIDAIFLLGGVGRVVRSTAEGFADGALVYGRYGGPTFARLRMGKGGADESASGDRADDGLQPLWRDRGDGLLRLARGRQVNMGGTVVVSGTTGVTGNAVGQLIKIKGRRVLGIVGGPAKCAWLRDRAWNMRPQPCAGSSQEPIRAGSSSRW